MKPFAIAAKRAGMIVVAALTATLAGCSVTEEVDRVAVGTAAPGQPALQAEALGRTLLVVNSGLRTDTPDRDGRGAEARRVVRQALAEAGIVAEEAPDGPGQSEEHLLQTARAAGHRSLLLVRVEDYTNLLRLSVPLPVPAPLVQVQSEVGVRLRLLNVADGAVLVDMGRDRTTGGYFTVRSRADLAPALNDVMRSLVRKS
jgi:hypothetical protein